MLNFDIQSFLDKHVNIFVRQKAHLVVFFKLQTNPLFYWFLILHVCSLREACDTSFLYWHRVIFSTYVSNLYENAIDVYKVKVGYSSGCFTIRDAVVKIIDHVLFPPGFTYYSHHSSSVLKPALYFPPFSRHDHNY